MLRTNLPLLLSFALAAGCGSTPLPGNTQALLPAHDALAGALGLPRADALAHLRKAGFVSGSQGLDWKTGPETEWVTVRPVGSKVVLQFSVSAGFRNNEHSLERYLGVNASNSRQVDKAAAFVTKSNTPLLVSQPNGKGGVIVVSRAPKGLLESLEGAPSTGAISADILDSVVTKNVSDFRKTFGAITSVQLEGAALRLVAKPTTKPFASATLTIQADSKRQLLLECDYGVGPSDYRAVLGSGLQFGKAVKDPKFPGVADTTVQSKAGKGFVTTEKGKLSRFTFSSR